MAWTGFTWPSTGATLNAVMIVPAPTQWGKFLDEHKGFQCSGIQRCIIGVAASDVSKERVAFILKGQVDPGRKLLPSQVERQGVANYIYQINKSPIATSYCAFVSCTLWKDGVSECSMKHASVQEMHRLLSLALQPFSTLSPFFSVSGSLSFQFLTPTLAMPSVTQSSHRSFGRPARLWPPRCGKQKSFGVAASSILMTSPSRLILATLITTAVSVSLKTWWFVIIAHTPRLLSPPDSRMIFLKFSSEFWVLASIEYT